MSLMCYIRPTLVLPDANLDVTAQRIVWGKFFNAGQASDIGECNKECENRQTRLMTYVNIDMHCTRFCCSDPGKR